MYKVRLVNSCIGAGIIDTCSKVYIIKGFNLPFIKENSLGVYLKKLNL